MKIQSATNKLKTTISNSMNLSNVLKRIKDAALKLVKEEPLTASGTFLTFGVLTAGIFSIISRTALKFMPLFGIPACLIFASKLLMSYKETKKLAKEEKELEDPS